MQNIRRPVVGKIPQWLPSQKMMWGLESSDMMLSQCVSLQTPSKTPPSPLQTPSKHPPNPFQTPSPYQPYVGCLAPSLSFSRSLSVSLSLSLYLSLSLSLSLPLSYNIPNISEYTTMCIFQNTQTLIYVHNTYSSNAKQVSKNVQENNEAF